MSTGTITNTSTIIINSGTNILSAATEYVNNGLIEVISGATGTVSAPLISGTGTMEIGSAGHLFLNAGSVIAGTIEAGQTIDFTDATGLLTIENNIIGGFDAIIGGFQHGDTITVHTTVAAGFSQSGSVVQVIASGITLGDLTFASVADATEALATPGALVACYAAGTRIRTAHGDVKVEALREGDVAITADGSEAPIIWIGHRTVDCKRHPQPKAVWPVRITAGAFGEGMPKRTLMLSPDHAVYVNKVLVPVKYLINGTTIVQVKADRVTYYHVELPQHDVLLAEGLPAESYLDTGDRESFANGAVVRLFPDFGAADAAMRWEAAACAPLIVAGPALERIQKQLRKHARTTVSRRRAA